jgi:Spy/CpxP family protein refolding chaperone
MNRALFLALALSLGLNAGLFYVSHREAQRNHPRSAAYRQDEPGGGRGKAEGRRDQPAGPEDFESIIRSHLNRMTEDLSLDRRQREAIGAVHERLLPQILDERRRMDSLRREVTSAYARPQLDYAEFRQLVRRVSNSQARIDSLITEAMLGEAAVLSDAQRERYVQYAPWGHPLASPERPGETQGPPRPGPPRPQDERPGQPPGSGQ